MIAFLDELFAKLFGARAKEPLPIRLRADDARPQDKQLKGRK